MQTVAVYLEVRRAFARARDAMNYPEGYIAEFVKDPTDVADFGIDWSKLGFDAGETIQSAAWAARSNDGTLVLSAQTLAGFVSSLTVSGGQLVSDYYDLSCHVTTAGGAIVRQHTRTIRLRIRNR